MCKFNTKFLQLFPLDLQVENAVDRRVHLDYHGHQSLWQLSATTLGTWDLESGSWMYMDVMWVGTYSATKVHVIRMCWLDPTSAVPLGIPRAAGIGKTPVWPTLSAFHLVGNLTPLRLWEILERYGYHLSQSAMMVWLRLGISPSASCSMTLILGPKLGTKAAGQLSMQEATCTTVERKCCVNPCHVLSDSRAEQSLCSMPPNASTQMKFHVFAYTTCGWPHTYLWWQNTWLRCAWKHNHVSQHKHDTAFISKTGQ